MTGEFFTILFLKNMNKQNCFSHLNEGRQRAEGNGHGRRDTEDNRMENVDEDMVEEEYNGG